MPFAPIKGSNLTRFSFVCLSAAILLCLAVLFLWAVHLPELMQYGDHHTITKFNMALCALLLGVAYLLIINGGQKKIGILLTLVVFLIGGLTVAEHLLNWNAGIDELIVKDTVTGAGNYPGRMKLGTALYFCFFAFAMFSIAYKKEHFITELLVIPLWTISFLTTIGYLFQLGNSIIFTGYSKLSPFAVLIVFFLSSAVFFGKTENGFLAPFTKNTTAARVNGRALVLSILLTLVFSWFRLQGELSGLILHNFGIVLMGLLIILMLLYTTRSNTIRLNRSEELIKREKELSLKLLDSIPGIFFLFDQTGKFIRQNKMYKTVGGYDIEEVEHMHALDFFKGEDKKNIEQMIDGAFEKGMMTTEAELCTKSGKKIPMFFTAVRIMYEGHPCILGSGIDIDKRKKAEHEVQLVNTQLRDLTKHMEHLREEERLNIAREIHDELGQQLTVLKVNLSWLQQHKEADAIEKDERLDKMVHLTEKTIHTIRKISFDLRPPIIDDLGLAEALKLYSKEIEMETGIRINFYTEMEMLRLSTATATALYRIYQECLTNIVRYAEATVVESSLDLQEGALLLSVSDNGKGFPVEELTKSKTLGVIGMRERAVMIGGIFTIHSQPGEGTHVQVTVSLENDL